MGCENKENKEIYVVFFIFLKMYSILEIKIF